MASSTIERTQVERIVRVSDEEIVASMRWMFERMKLVIEPSGATVIAALRNKRGEFGDAQQVGVIISGGNVDLARLPWC